MRAFHAPSLFLWDVGIIQRTRRAISGSKGMKKCGGRYNSFIGMT